MWRRCRNIAVTCKPWWMPWWMPWCEAWPWLWWFFFPEELMISRVDGFVIASWLFLQWFLKCLHWFASSCRFFPTVVKLRFGLNSPGANEVLQMRSSFSWFWGIPPSVLTLQHPIFYKAGKGRCLELQIGPVLKKVVKHGCFASRIKVTHCKRDKPWRKREFLIISEPWRLTSTDPENSFQFWYRHFPGLEVFTN